MTTIKTQEETFIDWESMDFGTEENSKCGICGKKEDGYWSKGCLIEDTICEDCGKKWQYSDDDGYEKIKNDE